MNRFRTVPAAVALILGVTLGCSSQPPQDEIDAVRVEIERARQVEAEIWAPEELRAAEEALAATQAAIAAQQGSWFKSYDQANQFLTRAGEEATAATEGAIASKAQTRADAVSAITAAENALENARTHIKNLPSTRVSRGDRAMFRNDLAALPARLEAARESLSAGDSRESLSMATEVESAVASAMDRLQNTLDRRPLPPK